MPIPHSFTLGRKERLKSRKKIQQIFKEGSSFYEYPFRVYLMISVPDENFLQAGFSVSKKYFKRAVHRNRVKRLMREAWRLNVISLKKLMAENHLQLNVFLIYTNKELPEFNLIQQKMKKVIGELERKVNHFVANRSFNPKTNQ